MPRVASAPAATSPEPPKAAGKVWTKAALDTEARSLVERRKLAHDAARYAFENSCGSKAACKHICDDPKKLTYNRVQPLLKQLKQSGKFADDDRDHHSQILTNTERRKLAGWILACRG